MPVPSSPFVPLSSDNEAEQQEQGKRCEAKGADEAHGHHRQYYSAPERRQGGRSDATRPPASSSSLVGQLAW